MNEVQNLLLTTEFGMALSKNMYTHFDFQCLNLV
jgi:hypothetical protein